MATDCVVDGDYLGAYSRFFAEFVARVNPNDQLPVKVSAYDVNDSELVGEVINVTLQYLNKTYCPPSLQSYIVHLVIQAIKSTCKKQPEICGLRQQEKTYAPLKLMQAITNEVNEICRRYLDNSRLALLPPPSSTPQVTVGATRNARRKMEDRHVVLHDLHTIFNIQDDTIANYYAVFDGHGGQDAATYCATHLHQYLVESVHYPTDPESALRDAFLTTDAQFIAKSSTQKLNGGTTAVCALMLNKKLYIAWVGDSMASLVSHGNVKQLVNPHRPTREDESERIRNMGGVVVHCMGVLRVNGFLSISRAIGDVPYKPYVSGEPEVRCVSLDGTEDFLIIACDGLWDYVDQRTAALRVYRQVLQNPHDLKHVHQALLQSAKRAGSVDNITVIVVFLTSPVEIASQHSLLTHPAPNGLLLNSMDPNNPVSSNSGQFDVNASFIKQQQQQAMDPDLNHMICGMTRNGKHQDSDGNDDYYDYGDLGPETDVDGGEDANDVNRLLDHLVTSSSCEKSAMEIDNEDDSKKEDLLNRDNANVSPMDSVVSDNRVRLSDRDVRCDEKPRGNNDDDDNDNEESRVESTTGTHTLVDDDESPPSPRDAKSIQNPLQHALISEAENVVDSEDSEDEWNYYRIDPTKKESATTAVATGESSEDVEKQNIQDPESGPKGDSEVQSLKVEADIKCEESEEETSLEPINIDISQQKEPSESEKDHAYRLDDDEEKPADDNKKDMNFPLNPEAAEFVPSLSPPVLNNKNVLQDYPISGSPLKQTPAMDDILIPSQSEFEKEASLRPKDIDEDFSSDKHAASDNLLDMDASEISSTKAEVDDESTARIASTTQWQADNTSCQWSATTRDDSGPDLEEYEVVNIDNVDVMTTSFTPAELEVAFEKSIDLNAVHNLNDISDDEEHVNTPPRSPGGPCAIENVRADTPLLDDKEQIDLLCASSTPYPADNESRTATSESDEAKDVFSVFKAEGLPTDQLGVAPLADDCPIQVELITSDDSSNLDKFTISDELNPTSSTEENISEQVSSKTNENPSDDQQPIDSSNEKFEVLSNEFDHGHCLFPEKSTQEDEERLTEDKTQSKLISETEGLKNITIINTDLESALNRSTQWLLKNESNASNTEENVIEGKYPCQDFSIYRDHPDPEKLCYVEPDVKLLNWSPKNDEMNKIWSFRTDTNFENLQKTIKEIEQKKNGDEDEDDKHDKDGDDPQEILSKKMCTCMGYPRDHSDDKICFYEHGPCWNWPPEEPNVPVTYRCPLLDDPNYKKVVEDVKKEREEKEKQKEKDDKHDKDDQHDKADKDDKHDKNGDSKPDNTNPLDPAEDFTIMKKLQERIKEKEQKEKEEQELLEFIQEERERRKREREEKDDEDEDEDDKHNKDGDDPQEILSKKMCTCMGYPRDHSDDKICFYEHGPCSNWPPEEPKVPVTYRCPLLDDPNHKKLVEDIKKEREEKEKQKEKDDKDDKHDKDDKPDKDDKHDKDDKNGGSKPDNTNPPDPTGDFTIVEKETQFDDQKTNQPIMNPSCTLLNNTPIVQKQVEDVAPVESTNICEVSEKQIASEDIPVKKEEETKPQEIAKASTEDVAKIEELKEQITGTAEAVVQAVSAVTTVSTTKAKATTTTTKRPTKTTTKTATKTLTSPSKTITSTTTRTSATSLPSQLAPAKRPIAARPKQLVDGSTKAAAISSTSNKATSTKTMISSKTTTTTATKTSASPRIGTIKSKTSTTSTASSKLSTLTEKKPVTNLSETKNVSKVAAKPTSAKTMTTKTTQPTVKSLSSTTSNVTSKPPRSTSAGTTVKTSMMTSKQSVTALSRPKTAPPTSSGATKTRENSAKTIPAKSPLIDKQSKDSANKEISRSSAAGTLSLSSKTGSKPSVPVVGSTPAKSRLSLGKSPGKTPGNAISPKSALTPKSASRTASSTPRTKSTPLTGSQKVLQNGISENRKPEDDLPRKDASPVNVPNDNQLIITD